MSEIKELNNLEKKEVAQTDLGKVAEKLSKTDLENGKKPSDSDRLSDDDLNKPIDEIVNKERNSLDCRSECKYNTGDRSKYSNYGYSD